MEETAQISVQLFVELMTILESLEAVAAIQHATLVELQDTLEEQGTVEAELRQALAERDTAQQAVEAERQQYQTLFDLAPDGYLVTNTVGVIREANPESARLLGMPRRWLVGKPLAGFVARQEAQRFHTLLHTLHVEPPSGQAWIGDFHPPRGQPFLGELTVAIRQEVSPSSKWYHWLLRDISARVQAEAVLHHTNADHQRLESEAQRAAYFALLGRLAADMSHEIRDPLEAVMLHVDLVEEGLRQHSSDSAEELAQSLTEIKINVVRLDDLVQDYLSLVHVAPIEWTPQDLQASVQAWATERHARRAALRHPF
jgi:PAS domain S-box-containing protein